MESSYLLSLGLEGFRQGWLYMIFPHFIQRVKVVSEGEVMV